MQILSNIKGYFFTLPQLKAIHIKLIDDTRDRKEITLIQTKKGIEVANIEQLSAKNTTSKKETKTPIALTIKGKGILIKSYTFEENEENIDWFSKLVPGAIASDFYIQIFGDENQKQVAFARKSLIDPILQEVENEGNVIIFFSLGSLALANLFSLIPQNNYHETWDAGNFTFNLAKDKQGIYKIISWQYAMQSHDLVIDTEIISANTAITYATGLNALLQPEKGVENSRFENAREQTIYDYAFKKLGIIALVAILCIVLLNTVAFQYYFKKAQSLELSYAQTSIEMKEVEDMKQKLASKNAFLIQEGWSQSPKMSYYADCIAANVPQEISLTKLEIAEQDKKAERDKKEYKFDAKTIIVEGQTPNGNTLNDWLQVLKQQKFVSDAEIINYKLEETTQKGLFSILIKIK